TFCAHTDAIRVRRRVEFHRRRPGRTNAGFDVFSQRPQVEIAGADFDPGVGHTDERFLQIVIGESGAFEHRPRRSAVRAGRQGVLSVSTHACISRESGWAFVAEAGLQLRYEPSTRTSGANS